MIARIEIEGLDKTGKDTLMKYIDYMSDRTIVVKTRGLLSNLVYADMYNRIILNKQGLIDANRETLIIFLSANLADLKVRFKIHNEPGEPLEGWQYFTKWKAKLKEQGIQILEFNTSDITPYRIAEKVLEYIENGGYNL